MYNFNILNDNYNNYQQIVQRSVYTLFKLFLW